MKRLQDRIALITGAASGIGAATATRFHAEGAIVVLTDIDDAAGVTAAQALRDRARYLHLDVRQEDDWVRVFAELVRQPLAFDEETETAALGESAALRAEQIAAGRVDDLVLRDADGREFAWRQIGRKKKVLVTWASW